MFQCFETPDMRSRIFNILFQFVSKLFETGLSVDKDIFAVVSICLSRLTIIYSICFETQEMGLCHFCLFQFDSVSLICNLYASVLQNTRYGVQNFHLFCFSLFRNVSKQVKVWTSIIFSCFNLFQSVYYIIYMFQLF